MRKIDYYGQLILLSLILLAALLCLIKEGFILFALLGLLILGPWQLISAIGVTMAPQFKIYKKQLRSYWIASISLLVIFTGGIIFINNSERDFTKWIFGISVTAGAFIALYYIYLYKTYFLRKPVEETAPGDFLPPL